MGIVVKRGIFTVTAIVVILLLTGGSIFWLSKSKSSPLSPEKCMYWVEDHYEPIDCNGKFVDVPIVPLDIRKLSRFKKITIPDTLTTNSLGKTWYIRTGNQREYFTDSGTHPVDTLRKLKPLSEYILIKHISNHRHLLKLLLWSICVIVSIILSLGLAISFRRKSPLITSSPFSTKLKTP